MKWRRWNRWIHRELGFLFFGMAIVYGISGIALNHGVARHWDPGVISRSETFQVSVPPDIDRPFVEELLEVTGQRARFKQYYFPDEETLMIYLRGGHMVLDLPSGTLQLTHVRTRPFFSELNYLHYNKPKKLWTWFSDLFAFALVLLSFSGILMVRGKKGISGQGGVLLAAGILIPLAFLAFYLWF